ncbi:chitosanase [Streptomyces sp. bgisy100]|uniref:chitosanase n=1 Tax=Streptomyces sp. bgisy100 TaxID=3413783 RepID=UPI003D743A11
MARGGRGRKVSWTALGLVVLAVPVVAVAVSSGPEPPRASAPVVRAGLDDPGKKEIAMRLVSSAENSSLDWRAQYAYIEDIGDGRGYTAGIIGFCSGTGDLLKVVRAYTDARPGNRLARYLPALRQVVGSASHEGLDPGFPRAWRAAAKDPAFRRAQDEERDRDYFGPAVRRAKADGVGVLGQFAYYDTAVVHGARGLRAVREKAVRGAEPPARGGDEVRYLHAFLDARVAAMREEKAHRDTSRVDTAQRVFLERGNLALDTPLDWKVYGDRYHLD